MNEAAQSIGFAIAGTGSIAAFHATAIAATPGARLVAVCTRAPEKARAFAEKFGAVAESTLDALLA
ncbi:MAG TPA: Gfo/Idh/MocA family oxidoreductase, partial [Opitutus sp.]|nr:Gfo/Idh/MocA family oxidoreductase [Opitutus sp.]